MAADRDLESSFMQLYDMIKPSMDIFKCPSWSRIQLLQQI